jgi:hypothetical protein
MAAVSLAFGPMCRRTNSVFDLVVKFPVSSIKRKYNATAAKQEGIMVMDDSGEGRRQKAELRKGASPCPNQFQFKGLTRGDWPPPGRKLHRAARDKLQYSTKFQTSTHNRTDPRPFTDRRGKEEGRIKNEETCPDSLHHRLDQARSAFAGGLWRDGPGLIQLKLV